MKPDFKIESNDVDITSTIKPYLTRLELKDESGFKNDSLTLTIANPKNHFKLPNRGKDLTVSLGYDGDLVKKGSFEVSDIKLTSPPDTLTILAVGAKINASLKIKHTQTFTNIALGDLVSQIALKNSMKASVSTAFQGVKIDHINQTNQSDQHFLAELAKRFDARFKPLSNHLLFYKQDDFKSVSVEALIPIIINQTDCTRFEFNLTDRPKYQSVKALWWDLDAAQSKQVIVGNGEPAYTLSAEYATEVEAKQHAQSKYNQLQRQTVTGTVDFFGNANLAGEFEVKLLGFSQDLPKRFKVESCVHIMDGSGYKTNAKIVMKK